MLKNIFIDCNVFLLFCGTLRAVSAMYCRSKKEKKTIYFNPNYCTEIKLVLTIMKYNLFQFDALKFFLGARLHGGSLPNINFFNLNPQNVQ